MLAEPSSWANAGDLAIAALDYQLEMYSRSRSTMKAAATSGTASLLETAAAKFLQVETIIQDPVSAIEAMSAMPESVIRRAFGENWELVPYTIVCIMRAKGLTVDLESAMVRSFLTQDIDEW